jgi:hypothetical protein
MLPQLMGDQDVSPISFLGSRPPMPRSDVYRRRARDCGVLADAASDLEGRQYYLQLALVWNDMARADEAIVSQEIPALWPASPSDA